MLEAGEDMPPGREPADVRSVFPLAAFNERYMWPDTACTGAARMIRRQCRFPRGG